jgi:hypothetical protein
MSIAALAAALAGPGANLRLRQGSVVSGQVDGTVTITIAGSATQVAGVKYIDSYHPLAGDTVWLATDGRDLFIIGRLGAPRTDEGSYAFTGLVANTPKSQAITFTVPFETVPSVVATPTTSVPQICSVGTASVTTDGFTLWFCRTNTTDTSVCWIAVSR